MKTQIDGDAREDRIVAAIVGLAVGDALGYPHEFRTTAQVKKEIGPEGITDFVRLKDPRFSRPYIAGTDHPPGTFTDDTQMSIALAEALISHGATRGEGGHEALMRETARRFVDWYFSDENDRSPGAATGSACEKLRDGVSWQEAGTKDSKGAGANMRVVPVGLFYEHLDEVERVAREQALDVVVASERSGDHARRALKDRARLNARGALDVFRRRVRATDER